VNETPYPPPPPRQAQIRVSLPARTPWVTYGLIFVTIGVYILQFLSQSIFNADIPAFWGMKINFLIRSGEYWRLVTPLFLHGSIFHIGFNMYALAIIGMDLERQMGHGRYAALYFLSGFAGNVFSFLFSSSPSLGSSTAIFGVLAAEGVFLFQNRALFGERANRALKNVLTIAGINLLIGLSPGIDNWGHLGGLLGGVIFAWFASPRWVLDGIYPTFSLRDSKETRDVFLGALLTLFLFGALASIGFTHPLVP